MTPAIEGARAERTSAALAVDAAKKARDLALAALDAGAEDAKAALRLRDGLDVAAAAVRAAERRLDAANAGLASAEQGARDEEIDSLRPVADPAAAREELARLAEDDVNLRGRHRDEQDASRARMLAAIQRQAGAVARSRELGAVDVPAALATTAIGVHLLAAEYAAAVERGERVDLLQHVRELLHAADLASFEHALRPAEMSLDEQRSAILDGSLRARVHELQAQREAQQAEGDKRRERKDRIRMLADMPHHRAFDAIKTWKLDRDPEAVAIVNAKATKRTPETAPETVSG